MHEAVTLAVAGHVAGLGVVGELVAMRLAATLLVHHGIGGEHGDAVDVVVVERQRVAGHQVAAVVHLLDVRRLAGHPDAAYLLVGVHVDLGQVAGHLHGALGQHDMAGQRGDAVWRVEAVEGIGVDDVHRLVAVILPGQRGLQKQQADRDQAEPEHSAGAG